MEVVLRKGVRNTIEVKNVKDCEASSPADDVCTPDSKAHILPLCVSSDRQIALGVRGGTSVSQTSSSESFLQLGMVSIITLKNLEGLKPILECNFAN